MSRSEVPREGAMFRSNLIVCIGAVALGLVVTWLASPSTPQSAPPAACPCKVRNVVRRRRNRKAPLRRLRPYARRAALPHLPRHAPCIERS